MKEVGVLGSGLMGHGIAYATACAGYNVTLIDLSKDIAEMGLEKIKTILKNDLVKNTITKQKYHDVINRITTTSDYKSLKNKKIVIEAILENTSIKSHAILLAEKHMDPSAIFATNTSTIPISILAEKSSNPTNFIGLHFFSPVNKMKLVEIIKGKHTSTNTLNITTDFAKQINKTPIIVNDSPGFYTTRVFEKYPCEGMAMLNEGVKAISIENAGKEAGFPIGPLAISDEINIGLISHIRKQILKYQKYYGRKNSTGSWDDVIDKMTSKLNRTGRAENGGFYEYPKDKKKFLWNGLEKHFPISSHQISKKDIIDRIYFAQVLEAVHCYEEKIITSTSDANIGSLLGWGFPSSKGGVLQFVNDYGITEFIDRSKQLAKEYGARFNPPSLLLKMAESGKIF